MHDDFRVVTLENLAGGALKERFDAALEKVMANIYDENTQANAKSMEVKNDCRTF